MKKINAPKKLILNRTTVQSLTSEQLTAVNGGYSGQYACDPKSGSCNSHCACTARAAE